MIEHADTALERWLAATVEVASIDFVDGLDATGDAASSPPTPNGAGTKGARRAGVAAVVSLTALAEKVERRDRQIADVRDGDGRVTARQRSLRWFELDYRVTLAGDARAAHALLGQLVQALVDDDVIGVEHMPDELAALGVPVEIELRSGSVTGRAGAALAVRLVVPVQPRADVEIAEPVTELDLEMSPAPTARAAVLGDDELLLADRRWTTVRRREMIAPPDAATARTAGARS